MNCETNITGWCRLRILQMSNPYDQLMPLVVDARDLGSAVIGGIECDHLAFRTKDA